MCRKYTRKTRPNKLIGLVCLLFLLIAQSTWAQKNSRASQAFVLGEIQELYSQVLGEKRILNIYLPEGYNTADSVRYPVVYLLDGSANEDFIHVVGLFQFHNFAWINNVPKSIIVGIANIDRERDFTFPSSIDEERKRFPTTGHSAKFIQFIQQELQAYIDQQYKTTSGKTLIGESLGGLLATEILLKKSQLFDHYIIISPSLWWDNGSLLQLSSSLLHKDYPAPIKVYIGVGKEGLGLSKQPHVMEVDANILAERLEKADNKNLKVYFDYLPQENHATVTHQALFNALRLLYPLHQK